jgi:hypothetical protein
MRRMRLRLGKATSGRRAILTTAPKRSEVDEERLTTRIPVFDVPRNLCYAFYFERTTKRLFAVRFYQDARQTSSLSCIQKHTTKILFAKNARQRSCLSCVFSTTHDKVFCSHTRTNETSVFFF